MSAKYNVMTWAEMFMSYYSDKLLFVSLLKWAAYQKTKTNQWMT